MRTSNSVTCDTFIRSLHSCADLKLLLEPNNPWMNTRGTSKSSPFSPIECNDTGRTTAVSVFEALQELELDLALSLQQPQRLQVLARGHPSARRASI